jgi:hypothetical protein
VGFFDVHPDILFRCAAALAKREGESVVVVAVKRERWHDTSLCSEAQPRGKTTDPAHFFFVGEALGFTSPLLLGRAAPTSTNNDMIYRRSSSSPAHDALSHLYRH